MDDEEQFARLRFYFWRYLDWRQRLSVLVQRTCFQIQLIVPCRRH